MHGHRIAPPGAALLQLGGHRGGRPPQAYALIDEADLEFASQWKWSYVQGYGLRMMRRPDGGNRPVLLHRALLGLQPGDGRQVDHINRDKLDNRRSNLRIVTQRENNHNMPPRQGSSRFRGVRKCRDGWQAYVTVDGGFRHLGVFNSEEFAGGVAFMARKLMLEGAVD